MLKHELRWNPLLREWIIVAGHRRARPWRPEEKKRMCPFCPGAPEIGDRADWDVMVLPNKYPALRPDALEPKSSRGLFRTAAAKGFCEVVIETPEHEGDLCNLSLEHMKKVVDAYTEEYRKLGHEDFVKYVMIFRNKGKEIGVSLTHPHSQIYALPFIPPRPRRELESCRDYHLKEGRCLICDILAQETQEGERLIYENDHMIAFLPFYAMWPYEVHIVPRKHVRSLMDLKEEEKYHLADILRAVTAIYNALFDFDMPYIMVFHQEPTDGNDYGYYHMHIEFYPPYRERDKLKYAAGIEWGAGTFTYDGIPEEKARELRRAGHKAIEKGDYLGHVP